MSKVKDAVIEAQDNYQKLQDIVNSCSTIDELATLLKGYNLKAGLYFDVNFKNIKALVYYDYQSNKISLCDEIDIINPKNGEVISEGYIIPEVVKHVCKY